MPSNDDLYIAIAQRLLSLSQAYLLHIDCAYQREEGMRPIGFHVTITGTGILRGYTSTGGYGYHTDNQARAMVEALDQAYRTGAEQGRNVQSPY